MLIKIEDGQPVGNPILDENLRLLHPNVSFPDPMTRKDVEPYGFGIYEQSPAPAVGEWQKAVEVTPVVNPDGIWVQTWRVDPLTPAEREEKEGFMRGGNKRTAEALLSASDWTVLPDVDLVNKEDWKAYRALLRAIAQNPPLTAQWPTKPAEIWG